MEKSNKKLGHTRWLIGGIILTVDLFFRFLKVILKVRMEYRFDFILGAIGQIIGYGANYLIVWILLQQFKIIDGWNWPEIALLISLSIVTYAIGSMFTYTPMTSLSSLILQGDFDKFLTKPISPLLNLMASFFNYGYIAHILISVSILIWSILQLSVDWGLFKIIYLLSIIVSGSFLQASFLIILGCMNFRFLRVDFLFNLYGRLKGFMDYPLSIYAVYIKIILTWIIPLAFINYYPSLFLLDKEVNILTWIAPIVGPVIFLVSLGIWSIEVNRYQGTGS